MRRINKPSCPNPKALRTNYKHPKNKEALVDASYGKCMYCESKIGHVYSGDIEHIKPKSRFPQFKYDWDNLGFVCSKCNNAKRDKYDDRTPYINPYNEDPAEHLTTLGAFLKHLPGSTRGEVTTIDIELNRPDLLEKRQDTLKQISLFIDCYRNLPDSPFKQSLLEQICSYAANDKEFSLVIEGLLKSEGLI